MTNEETIDMAKQCGHWSGQTVEMNDVGVLRFAEMIAERCAKKCDDNALKLGVGLGNTALRVTAMDIRAGRL